LRNEVHKRHFPTNDLIVIDRTASFQVCRVPAESGSRLRQQERCNLVLSPFSPFPPDRVAFGRLSVPQGCPFRVINNKGVHG
jgi:hypothetical protein